MKGLNTLEDLITPILEKNLYARCSDTILYLAVCEKVLPGIANWSMDHVLTNRNRYGLPDFESVGRIRRKVQKKREDLRATEEITDGRYENWKECREYAFKED